MRTSLVHSPRHNETKSMTTKPPSSSYHSPSPSPSTTQATASQPQPFSSARSFIAAPTTLSPPLPKSKSTEEVTPSSPSSGPGSRSMTLVQKRSSRGPVWRLILVSSLSHGCKSEFALTRTKDVKVTRVVGVYAESMAAAAIAEGRAARTAIDHVEFHDGDGPCGADETGEIVVARIRIRFPISIPREIANALSESCSTSALVLEPLAGRVTVISQSSSNSDRAFAACESIIIEPSIPRPDGSRSFVYLRPGDTICFLDFGLQILVVADEADSTQLERSNEIEKKGEVEIEIERRGLEVMDGVTADSKIGGIDESNEYENKTEIQVTSSEVEADQSDEALRNTNEEGETEDEEYQNDTHEKSYKDSEFNKDSKNNKQHLARKSVCDQPLDQQQTPRTSSRITDDGIPTVKETPNQFSAEHAKSIVPSTAPNDSAMGNETHTVAPIESPSPLAVKQRKRKDDSERLIPTSQFASQLRAGTNLLDSIHAITPAEFGDNIAASTAHDEHDRHESYGPTISNDIQLSPSNLRGRLHIAKDSALSARSSKPNHALADGNARRNSDDAASAVSTGRKRKSSGPGFTAINGSDTAGSTKRRKTDSPPVSDCSEDGEGTEPSSSPSAVATTTKKKPRRCLNVAPPTSSLDEIVVTARTPQNTRTDDSRSSPHVVINVNDKDIRTTTPGSANSSPHAGNRITKILLSRTTLDARLQRWLTSKGVKVVEDVPTKRTNFVCVVPDGELKKTPKLLRTLCLGKYVVTHDWLSRSKEQDVFLAPDAFLPPDLRLSPPSRDRSRLFAHRTLLFTDALIRVYGQDGWADIQTIAREAGAGHVGKCTVATDGPVDGYMEGGSGDDEHRVPDEGGPTSATDPLFFGNEVGDDDVASLVHNYRRTVYHKDLLTHAIITGEVDLHDVAWHLGAATVPSTTNKPASTSRRGKKR